MVRSGDGGEVEPGLGEVDTLERLGRLRRRRCFLVDNDDGYQQGQVDERGPERDRARPERYGIDHRFDELAQQLRDRNQKR